MCKNIWLLVANTPWQVPAHRPVSACSTRSQRCLPGTVSRIWDLGSQVPPVAGPRLTSRAWDGICGLRRAQEEVGASGPSRGQVGYAGVVGALQSRGHPGGPCRGPPELASPHVAGPTWKGRRRKEGEGGWSHCTSRGTPARPQPIREVLGWAGVCLPCPAPLAARSAIQALSPSC